MDKLRVALNWIVAHHFWLLSGLIVLLGIGVWFMAKNDLSARYEENVKKIDAAFGKQRQYAGKPFLPNDLVNQGQQQEINRLIEDVQETWSELYERQREQALIWPPGALSERFRNYIANRKFGDTIDANLRSEYFTYINRRFDDLPKMIGANEMDATAPSARSGGEGRRGGGPGFSRGGGGPRGPSQELGADGQPIDENFIVWWEPEDQMRIKDELTSTQVQSHWRIWTTQEDLWVYETLLKAIAATNKAKGAERYSNAAVRAINAMEVGRPAAEYSRTPGRIYRQEARAAAAGGDGEMLGGGAGASQGEFRSEGEGEATEDFSRSLTPGQQLTPAEEKAVMLSRRYIDKEGKPISVPPDDTPLELSMLGTGFKQLPVRLDLEMDTRYINTLIVELANAPLRIMVTEVRINPQFVESGGAGGGRGGSARRGFEGGYGGRSSGFGNQREILVFDRQPHIKPVILQGVVQIFHQPDPNAFGTPESGAEDPGTFATYP